MAGDGNRRGGEGRGGGNSWEGGRDRGGVSGGRGLDRDVGASFLTACRVPSISTAAPVTRERSQGPLRAWGGGILPAGRVGHMHLWVATISSGDSAANSQGRSQRRSKGVPSNQPRSHIPSAKGCGYLCSRSRPHSPGIVTVPGQWGRPPLLALAGPSPQRSWQSRLPLEDPSHVPPDGKCHEPGRRRSQPPPMGGQCHP